MTKMTVEVTWGEALRLEVDRWSERTQLGWTELADLANTIEPAVRGTYRKLLYMTEVPASPKWQRRAYALVLAMGQSPSEFGLADARPDTWAPVSHLEDAVARRIIALGRGGTHRYPETGVDLQERDAA